MNTLRENLRRQLLARIERGELTGLALAERAGFRQAHISNFLNRKRGLSVEGMDRILHALNLNVMDLLPAAELSDYHAGAAADRDYENIPLVAFPNAADAILSKDITIEILKFKKTFLRRLRADLATDREHWARFVLVKAGHEDGAAMYPRLQANATLLIDRHYNTITPYRKGDRTLFAIRKPDGFAVRYVELHGRQIMLRPQNDTHPLDFITINSGRTYADYIIGRICHIAIET